MLESPRKKGMSFIILDTLQEKPLHGYAIAERIEKIYGVERPSSGLIYPILSSLQKNHLVRIYRRGERDKKIYEITPKGLRYLEEHASDVERSKNFLYRLGKFHGMGGHALMDSIKLLIENMDNLSDEQRIKIGEVLRDCSRKIRWLVEVGEENE